MVTRARYFLRNPAAPNLDDCLSGPSRSPDIIISSLQAGRVSSEQEGAHGGRAGKRQKRGSTHHDHGGERRSRPLGFTTRRGWSREQYTLRIRAAGFDLGDPGAVEVTQHKTAQLDLKLGKTKDLSAQLTNAEWLMSFPGNDDRKKSLLNCIHCHTLQRIVRDHYDAADMKKVVLRMGHANHEEHGT